MKSRIGLVIFLLATGNVAATIVTQAIILSQIGPGNATDAFVASLVIPQTLAGIVAVALSSVLVPALAGEPPDHQASSAWGLLLIVGVTALPLALLLSLSANIWTVWLFPGFDMESRQLCAALTQVQMFSMPFVIAHSVVAAVCYARRQFLRIETVTLGLSIISAGALYLALPSYGIQATAWISTTLALLQLLIMLPGLGFPRLAAGSLRVATESWRQIKPLLAGNAYYKSDVLVDRYLLSTTDPGVMTLFNLAQQIYGAAVGVLGKTWGNTAIPTLAVYSKQGNANGFFILYRRRLLTLLFASTTLYLLLLLAGPPALSLVIGSGNSSAGNVTLFWSLLACLGGVLVFGSLGIVTSGAFYAIGDTRTPTILGVASFTLFVIVKILSFQAYGTKGIAIAATCYYATNVAVFAGILPFIMRRHLSDNASKLRP